VTENRKKNTGSNAFSKKKHANPTCKIRPLEFVVRRNSNAIFQVELSHTSWPTPKATYKYFYKRIIGDSPYYPMDGNYLYASDNIPVSEIYVVVSVPGYETVNFSKGTIIELDGSLKPAIQGNEAQAVNLAPVLSSGDVSLVKSEVIITNTGTGASTGTNTGANTGTNTGTNTGASASTNTDASEQGANVSGDGTAIKDMLKKYWWVVLIIVLILYRRKNK
jgi:hypothetical protein